MVGRDRNCIRTNDRRDDILLQTAVEEIVVYYIIIKSGFIFWFIFVLVVFPPVFPERFHRPDVS